MKNKLVMKVFVRDYDKKKHVQSHRFNSSLLGFVLTSYYMFEAKEKDVVRCAHLFKIKNNISFTKDINEKVINNFSKTKKKISQPKLRTEKH